MYFVLVEKKEGGVPSWSVHEGLVLYYEHNALSLARNLAKEGFRVKVVSAQGLYEVAPPSS